MTAIMMELTMRETDINPISALLTAVLMVLTYEVMVESISEYLIILSLSTELLYSSINAAIFCFASKELA